MLWMTNVMDDGCRVFGDGSDDTMMTLEAVVVPLRKTCPFEKITPGAERDINFPRSKGMSEPHAFAFWPQLGPDPCVVCVCAPTQMSPEKSEMHVSVEVACPTLWKNTVNLAWELHGTLSKGAPAFSLPETLPGGKSHII